MPKVKSSSKSFRSGLGMKYRHNQIPKPNDSPVSFFSNCHQYNHEQYQQDETISSTPSFSSLEQQYHSISKSNRKVSFEDTSSCPPLEDDVTSNFLNSNRASPLHQQLQNNQLHAEGENCAWRRTTAATLTPIFKKRSSLSNLPKILSRRSGCLSTMVNQNLNLIEEVTPSIKSVSEDNLTSGTATTTSLSDLSSNGNSDTLIKKSILCDMADDSPVMHLMSDEDEDEFGDSANSGWGQFVDVIPVERSVMTISRRSRLQRDSPSLSTSTIRYSPYGAVRPSLCFKPGENDKGIQRKVSVPTYDNILNKNCIRSTLRHSTSTNSISATLCNVKI